MANKTHGGLGKGLGALLKNTQVTPAKDKVQELSVQDIQANRHQPRREFDEAALEELKESVRQYGVLQPVLVRRLPEKGYELIAGERRFRAAKLAGLKNIPAIIREYSDAEVTEIALIENLQREDLNAIEEARAYGHLMQDFGLTQEILSRKIGRSRSHIANFLRLLKLDAQVQEYVANGSLTMGQAKPLLALEDIALQAEAAEYIMAEELSAREAENLVKRLQKEPDFFQKGNEEKKPAEEARTVFVTEAEDRLKLLFGTQVHIRPGKKKSRIEIEFYSEDDLNRVIETLTEKKRIVTEQKKEALRKFSMNQKFTV